MMVLCSDGYLPTIGSRLVRGRRLTEHDIEGARRVALVNETLVNKYLGSEDPIGRQIQLTRLSTVPASPVPNPLFEIVGVFADVKNRGIQDPPMPEVQVPYSVTGAFERGVLIRTTSNPLNQANALKREVWAIDRNIALTDVDSLESFLQQFTYATPRFSFILLGVFASVGMVLVAIGVFSVIAYIVSRQTHEIGIRIALGASTASVFRMVLVMGLRLIGIGAVVGIAASLTLNRVLTRELWHVSPYDPLTLGGVVAMIALVGLAACYFPARRATRVDPAEALRHG
jgi:putative ABC transport system permease protein